MNVEGKADDPDRQEVLEDRLRAIERALDAEMDVHRVEELLQERQALELRVTAVTIALQNRQKAQGGQDRAARLERLRAEHADLVGQRESLDRKLREAVAAAERDAPTPALQAEAWTLPHIRRLAEERAGLVASIMQVEKAITQLQPAEKEATNVRL